MPCTPEELHNAAMALVDKANTLRGDEKIQVLRRAAALEARAARMLPLGPESEPTRAVLWASAGWLALSAGAPRPAFTFATLGLASRYVRAQDAENLRRIQAAAFSFMIFEF